MAGLNLVSEVLRGTARVGELRALSGDDVFDPDTAAQTTTCPSRLGRRHGLLHTFVRPGIFVHAQAGRCTDTRVTRRRKSIAHVVRSVG